MVVTNSGPESSNFSLQADHSLRIPAGKVAHWVVGSTRTCFVILSAVKQIRRIRTFCWGKRILQLRCAALRMTGGVQISVYRAVPFYRVGATLAVALRKMEHFSHFPQGNKRIAPSAKGDRKGRPYAKVCDKFQFTSRVVQKMP